MLRSMRWRLASAAILLVALAGSTAIAFAAAGGPDRCERARMDGAPYDLRWIDKMDMHHRGAIRSARSMIADSSRPELRDLAKRIIRGQTQQLRQMRTWRDRWYPDTSSRGGGAMRSGMTGSGMMGSHGAMMGDEMMAMPQVAAGQRERMFLRMMIPHHQLAVEMAREALERAAHVSLRRLARRIVAGQAREIEEMERYLRAWYDEPSTRSMAERMRSMMGSHP